MDLNKLLSYSVDSGASDLHLSVGSIPMVRINGTMQPLNMDPLKQEDIESILPQILDELLAARKRAKKDMAAATDPMEKAVQNGRQLALKISANSVYGFTGATVGQLPCVPIASSTTSYGRELLLRTRTFVEQTYTIKNG